MPITSQQQTDEHFMRMALQEANQALAEGEIPIGAVVVARGRIIARAHNLTETLHDVTAHAEMQAITAAANLLGGKYLTDCTLYVTVEPCVMCAGAIGWAQIKRVVHGEESPTMIDNLKRTLIPDIAPNIKVIKALSVASKEDVARYKDYEGLVDLFLFDTRCPTMGGSGKQFDWDVLSAYNGHTPFLLSGGIGPDDAERVRQFDHPMLAGIDLNSRFETEPGRKDVDLLRTFIQQVRN